MHSNRIKNIYYMLAYAFRALHQAGMEEVAAEDFDHLHDLLAAILVHGLNRQIKQGLYRDYVQRHEDLAGVRGRIDVAGSLKTLSFTQGRLACEFDEFTIDTPHNRILKSTIKLLLQHGEVGHERKVALRRILPYLDSAADIKPQTFRWDRLTINRNNAAYRLLLGVCDLIMRALLPSTQSGNYKLAHWLPNEQLHQLFENFVRAYYKYHRPDLSPHSAQIKWNLAPGEFSQFLPVMETDIFLTDGDRILIIDTKYYQSAFQNNKMRGTRKYISNHLYQIHAYIKNCDKTATGKVAGMLLYAATNEPDAPDEAFTLGGSQVEMRTLDLAQDWRDIERQLNVLCAWFNTGQKQDALEYAYHG